MSNLRIESSEAVRLTAWASKGDQVVACILSYQMGAANHHGLVLATTVKYRNRVNEP